MSKRYESVVPVLVFVDELLVRLRDEVDAVLKVDIFCCFRIPLFVLSPLLFQLDVLLKPLLGGSPKCVHGRLLARRIIFHQCANSLGNCFLNFWILLIP